MKQRWIYFIIPAILALGFGFLFAHLAGKIDSQTPFSDQESLAAPTGDPIDSPGPLEKVITQTAPTDEPDSEGRISGKFPEIREAGIVLFDASSRALLDVAIIDSSESGVNSVVVELQGPEKTFFDIKLTESDERQSDPESAWEKDVDFLPSPIPGGLYWVSRIKAIAKDGSWSECYADSPDENYLIDFQEAAGEKVAGKESNAIPRALYVTEKNTGLPIYYINTFRPEDGEKVDSEMRLYRASNPKKMIAVNTEPEDDYFYPRLAVPLKPGEQYYIRIAGGPKDHGDYAVVVGASGFVKEGKGRGKLPDQYEPNNTHRDATPIKLGEVQFHTLDDVLPDGDTDWFVFDLPMN